MSIQFIGMIQTRNQSEIHPPAGPTIDPGYVRAAVQAHEQGGFDRILIGWYSNGADPLLVGTHAAAHTSRLGMLIAHRPGFQSPTTAARSFATLDQFSAGRAAVHVISGGDDTDQRRDGDFLDKDARYARTEEYVGLLKAIWTAREPVSHHGTHYRVEGASPEVRTVVQPRIPIYFGGASAAAIEVAGKHADIYMLWGETHAQVREIIAQVREATARHRGAAAAERIGFSLSFRPILAETEDAAWARAADILARVRAIRGEAALGPATGQPQNAGSQRLLEAAALGDRPEGRLYTAIALATGARGNTTALVGTPLQVAEALLEYHALGVDTFLIRGFEPVEDAIAYGETLIPLTRRLLAGRGEVSAAAE
jgi:alkanesulfonate monooxygenase